MSFTMSFFWSQLAVTVEYPSTDFSGKTVIVTGSNVGLGFEAAKHFVRLKAKKVILAVRNLEAGNKAKTIMEDTIPRRGDIEVWYLDLSKYESVKSFAERANSLERIDCLVENAGIATRDFKLFEEDESTIAVNVVSTFLLALLLLPKLQETATKFNTKPVLSIVSSGAHRQTKFEQQNAPPGKIFAALADEKSPMDDRYPLSKLLEVLVVRQIAPLISKSKNSDVTLNILSPGFCHSELARNARSLGITLMKLALARTTEMGSRTLLASAAAGPESHGKYMSDGVVREWSLSPFVRSPQGDTAGARVWDELKDKLEKISPGVTNCLT